MKIRAILVDKLPKNCEDCMFGHKKITEDDEPCDLNLEFGICPLVLEEDYDTLKDYFKRRI